MKKPDRRKWVKSFMIQERLQLPGEKWRDYPGLESLETMPRLNVVYLKLFRPSCYSYRVIERWERPVCKRGDDRRGRGRR